MTVSGQKMTHCGREERETCRRHAEGERQNKSTRVRREREQEKVWGRLTLCHSFTLQRMAAGRNEKVGFIFVIPLMGEKGVLQSIGTDSRTFTFLFQILWTVFESVCVHMCVRV
ncbi:Large tegument protein deneddylase [Labeo rohita]|uniref:Large tegument protein deneddylase n=1 Tax=Labeo rohita TaxID=84645 RepID=A0ABQ8MFQ9_LABRO|nr:Large tegument protein deneddylase [Labeo rohita]